MYTSKYCTTVVSILYNDFPLLGAKSDAGCPRSTRTPQFEEVVLKLVEENPSTSTWHVARTLHTSQNAIWQVHDQQLHPYHLQKVHALLEEDYPRRVQFAEWYLQQCILQPQFSSLVLFIDECTFTRNGILNLHNMHFGQTKIHVRRLFKVTNTGLVSTYGLE